MMHLEEVSMSMAEKKELIYTIDVGEKAVIVESDFYVPFEPKKSNPQIREKVVELYHELRESATRYYATIRENLDCIDIQGRIEDKSLFGMVLDITLPTKVLPASVMKPLLDGLICAFHGEEGRAEQTLKMMFDNSMDLTISSKKLNLFGDREYVSQYRGENSYKWNPEDERLQFAWITVHTGKSAELSGKIYQWK